MEAGLRTGNLASPFPEEANRSIIGRLATQHYAPTSWAAENLRREGVASRSVVVTGNTIVDALHWAQAHTAMRPAGEVPSRVVVQTATHRMILVTSHRRESFGDGLRDTFSALRRLVDDFPDTVVYPVHLNPVIQEAAQGNGHGHHCIHHLPVSLSLSLSLSLSYPTMLWAVQGLYRAGATRWHPEEAPSFSKPLLCTARHHRAA